MPGQSVVQNKYPQEIENFDMDVLADVLAATRIGNTLFCRKEFEGAWRMQVEHANQASFNIVSRGTCWLRMHNKSKPVQLVQGDVVLYPHGTGRVLADSFQATLFSEDQGLSEQRLSGHGLSEYGQVGAAQRHSKEGVSTHMYGGCYHFEHKGAHPLLSLLPELIHIQADEAKRASELQTTLRLLTQEVSREQPGARVVTSRLVDVIFIYIIRAWLERQPEHSAGWLGALGDAQVGKILGLIHREPHRHWTVELLAQQVSMSRAAFAKRFSDLVGEPPLTYLTRWRMDIAARLLRDTHSSLIVIAGKTGYETESSFSKAFRRTHGMSPGQYRLLRD